MTFFFPLLFLFLITEVSVYIFYVLSTDLCPKNASYYGNRAATLMMLSRYREALEDSQQAVRLDDTFMKVGRFDDLSISKIRKKVPAGSVLQLFVSQTVVHEGTAGGLWIDKSE